MKIFGWGSLTSPWLDGDVAYVVDFLGTWFSLHGCISLVDGALGLEV
jgi:hypothetical protein